ncbi:hypothetical protein [Cryobacterium serini]|nr:hypothetical protein [Cryobacterium serini]
MPPGETDRPHPIDWNILSAVDAEVEWIELNRWVNSSAHGMAE